MTTSYFAPRRGLCLLVLLGGLSHAGAPVRPPAGEVWQAVSDRTLDRLRGGFDAGGGVMVAFGLSRLVYINGEKVAQMTLDFGQITDMTPAKAAQITSQLAAWVPVQNGPGNSVQIVVTDKLPSAGAGALPGGAANGAAANGPSNPAGNGVTPSAANGPSNAAGNAAVASSAGTTVTATVNLPVGPAGSAVGSAVAGAPLATVIQNSLNNQQIVQQTVINASSNALGLVKSLNLQTTLNDALLHAVGGH